MPHSLTLILGGAASGKSAYAENIVLSDARDPVYIATAQAFDEEMRAKIGQHVERRGTAWRTIEAPMDLPAAMQGLTADHIVLIDCLTLWLTNHLLTDSDPAPATDALIAALAACPAPVVLVSNEVGLGIVPDNALARRFREAQGRLNIRMAQVADCVVQVVAGLPNVLKGDAP